MSGAEPAAGGDAKPRTLVVFVRAPRLGRVKTRLAASVGDERALGAYVALGRRVFDAVLSPGEWRCAVYLTPPGSEDEVHRWLPGAASYRPQSGGDLGERMAAAIAAELRGGADRVVLIGTDCPDLDAAAVARAFGALDAADVVLGPALDGGYYLVGMRRLHAPVFAGVPWSSADTLGVTLERAHAHGLAVALLEPLRDVDTESDWRAWAGAREAATHAEAPPSSSV